MRRSEFRERAAYIFGDELARTYARELVLVHLGMRSSDQAIEDGVPVAQVWHALCDEMDVPMHMRWEVPPEHRAGGGSE